MPLTSSTVACNERNTVRKSSVAWRLFRPASVEIILVDDFSTDGTRNQERFEGATGSMSSTSETGEGSALRRGRADRGGSSDPGRRPEYDPQGTRLLGPILREGGRGLRVAVRGRRVSGCSSTGTTWEPVPHHPVEHVHQHQPTDMETCYKAFREVIRMIGSRRTGSASSRR
jgi:hypothetical protein